MKLRTDQIKGNAIVDSSTFDDQLLVQRQENGFIVIRSTSGAELKFDPFRSRFDITNRKGAKAFLIGAIHPFGRNKWSLIRNDNYPSDSIIMTLTSCYPVYNYS